MLYKFNTEIGRHLAMPFIEIHLKKEIFRGVFGYLLLCQTPMVNLFLKKKMFGQVLNRALTSFLTIANAI